MTTQRPEPESRFADRVRRRLDRPASVRRCVTSWLMATVTFMGLSVLLGGPTEGDAAQSVYGTWSVAHGDLACVYPASTVRAFTNITEPYALTAPLYPLFSGAVAALLRIGHAVSFPTVQQLGPHCDNSFAAIFGWSVKSDAILPTIRLGYLVWFALLIGVVAFLRSSGRGRRDWEPFTLLLLSCTPPILMCLSYYFHPQDVLAMGLLVGGLACVMRKRWFWAGVLLGLAFSSQQFSVLVGATLLVAAPSLNSKVKFAVGAAISMAVIDIPIIIATSGGAIKTILLGSSRVGASIRSTGGTVLWETKLGGLPLFLVSRVAPILAAMLLAQWFARRLGSKILTPVPLLSLVATALMFRLMFEENLFGYYFMAIAVALVLLYVAAGQLRGPLVAWLGLVTLVFNPVHLGFVSNLTTRSVAISDAFPIALLAVALASVAYDVHVKRLRAYKVVWIVVVALTCEYTIFGMREPVYVAPHWLWQVVLVPTGLVLALRPLLNQIKEVSSGETPEGHGLPADSKVGGDLSNDVRHSPASTSRRFRPMGQSANEGVTDTLS
jgi:hypothetical protein